jgi:Flp pilus assembly protein TadB
MIAFLLLGVLAVLIFDAVWFRVGFGAAALIGIGGLILVAWRYDRREKAKRADLPPI